MAENTIHDLDAGVSEYFEFILFEHKYKFRYLTADELQELKKIGISQDNPDEKAQQYIYKFISKVDESAPEFLTIANKMTTAHLKKFMTMIKAEFGMDEI